MGEGEERGGGGGGGGRCGAAEERESVRSEGKTGQRVRQQRGGRVRKRGRIILSLSVLRCLSDVLDLYFVIWDSEIEMMWWSEWGKTVNCLNFGAIKRSNKRLFMKRLMNICGLSLLSAYVEIQVERFSRIFGFVFDGRRILIWRSLALVEKSLWRNTSAE